MKRTITITKTDGTVYTGLSTLYSVDNGGPKGHNILFLYPDKQRGEYLNTEDLASIVWEPVPEVTDER